MTPHDRDNRASLILMCTRCVPAAEFAIMEQVQKQLQATRYGTCSVAPPAGFEPALPPPEAGYTTCQRCLGPIFRALRLSSLAVLRVGDCSSFHGSFHGVEIPTRSGCQLLRRWDAPEVGRSASPGRTHSQAIKRPQSLHSSAVSPGNADPTTAYAGRPGCRAQAFNDRPIDSNLSTVDSRTSAGRRIAPGAACPVASCKTLAAGCGDCLGGRGRPAHPHRSGRYPGALDIEPDRTREVLADMNVVDLSPYPGSRMAPRASSATHRARSGSSR
jgi:hypothetical protein